MSDVAPSPSPVKGGQNKNQVILVAVLGVVLLLVLVFMVLKPFGGDDAVAPPVDTAVTTPAPTTGGAVAGAPAAQPAQPTTFQAAPRGRNPFDPPR